MGRILSPRLSPTLGWLSIGLGLANLVAPRRLARLIGASDSPRHRGVMAAVGLREIACGVGILTARRPVGWVAARIVGDLMDIALLGAELGRSGRARAQRKKARLSAALLAVGGVAVLDLLTFRAVRRSSTRDLRRSCTSRAITVNCLPNEAYRLWRQPENLLRFMPDLELKEILDDRCSLWRMKGPVGKTFEWQAEIIMDRPNEFLAWRFTRGSTGFGRAQLRFLPAPGRRGTEVKLTLEYDPPGGHLGKTIAKLFGVGSEQQVDRNLRRFKQVTEVGEIVHSGGLR